MYKVFIDGQAGTTGLRLASRLAGRADVDLIEIPEEERKGLKARLERIAAADVAFLCLPDNEAREIISAIDPAFADVHIIDCSTANRTAEGWVYGMPELFSVDESAKRISNPGCHATGFIMAVKPLTTAGIVDPEAAVCCHSLTGYSGGGKAMIAEYEGAGGQAGGSLAAPRQYALAQGHKHLPEMQKYSGLAAAPLFSPIVCDFYSGMLVCIPLPRSALRRSASVSEVCETLAGFYEGCGLVKVRQPGAEYSDVAGSGYLAADAFSGRDDLEIFVTGKDDKIEIVARFDNLGKGASGAAVQNMNLALGIPGETGLVLGD